MRGHCTHSYLNTILMIYSKKKKNFLSLVRHLNILSCKYVMLRYFWTHTFFRFRSNLKSNENNLFVRDLMGYACQVAAAGCTTVTEGWGSGSPVFISQTTIQDTHLYRKLSVLIVLTAFCQPYIPPRWIFDVSEGQNLLPCGL